MRYLNAAHVDYSGLHERRFSLGLPLAIIGCLLIPVSICGQAFVPLLVLLPITFVLWFVAWIMIVGAFYRMCLSAALLTQIVLLTLERLAVL